MLLGVAAGRQAVMAGWSHHWLPACCQSIGQASERANVRGRRSFTAASRAPAPCAVCPL